MVSRLEVPLGERRLHVGDLRELPNGDREVHPPSVLLFDQVVDILEKMPASRRRSKPSESRAAAAVCLRWGTYLALLADESRPFAAWAADSTASRLCDSEMARINIEATANLERWIRISYEEPKRYESLVSAAQQLPFPKIQIRGSSGMHRLVDGPQAEMLRSQIKNAMPELAERLRAKPLRAVANALFHYGWRNGPIEDLHAGQVVNVDFADRRFTNAEMYQLMASAVSGFQGAIEVSRALSPLWKTPEFAEAVAPLCAIGPSDWTLTESSRPAVLRRME